MKEINTNELKTRVKVKIDGHDFIVRRMGAGEQLQMNMLRRQHNELIKKLDQKDTKEEETENISTEMDKLQTKMLDVYTNMFNDGGDGAKSRNLVYSLDVMEIAELFTSIFKEDIEETKDEEQAENSKAT